MAVWDYRLIDDSVVPYDLRYQVLAESDRRCALCGATEKERPLDVDHIIPRSRGGGNEKSNLQVLCSRAKGNRDTRDFRGVRPPDRDSSCIFCGLSDGDAADDYGLVVAVADRYAGDEGAHARPAEAPYVGLLRDDRHRAPTGKRLAANVA